MLWKVSDFSRSVARPTLYFWLGVIGSDTDMPRSACQDPDGPVSLTVSADTNHANTYTFAPAAALYKFGFPGCGSQTM